MVFNWSKSNRVASALLVISAVFGGSTSVLAAGMSTEKRLQILEQNFQQMQQKIAQQDRVIARQNSTIAQQRRQFGAECGAG